MQRLLPLSLKRKVALDTGVFHIPYETWGGSVSPIMIGRRDGSGQLVPGGL